MRDNRAFDACYLGLGADGHCAGLFPGQVAVTGTVTREPGPGGTEGKGHA